MKLIKKSPVIKLILLITLVSVPFYGQQKTGFKIIVNESVETTTFKRTELAKIFLKKKKSWLDDQSIFPVNLISEVETRENFTRIIHTRSVKNIKSWWHKQIFTGKEVPPVELENDLEVLKFVENTPGAIGYVSDNTDLGNYKVKLVMIE